MTLAKVAALAVASRTMRLAKPWMWSSTCTPGLRDDREQQMATWIETTLGGTVNEEDARDISRALVGFVTWSPAKIRATAAALLTCADEKEQPR